jgi:ABC-type lipoprotein export system ATPase subunit
MSRYYLEKIIPPYFSPDPSSDIWNQTFSLEKNKRYSIHAASGKGKSTFLNILIGFEKQYQGDIAYSEISLKALNSNEIALNRSKKWSVVFQDLKLIDHLTALENLNLQKGIKRLDSKDLLDRLGLFEKMDEQVSHLSWGEKQRLAIARALIKEFEFLLLDEPFSHLDERNKQICWDLISESCFDQKASVVLLGHHTMPELGIENILAL